MSGIIKCVVTQRVILFCTIMLSVCVKTMSAVMTCVIMLNVIKGFAIMLGVLGCNKQCYKVCHHAQCYSGDCCGAK